ncbi:MAG: sensor histidine kinase [Patescibacteria group bacterium]
MFQQLKFKLTFLFTSIAVLLKVIFGSLYMIFEYSIGLITVQHLIPHAQVMLLEIGGISIFTFIIGYFFIDSIVNTVEDKFNRLEEFTQDASHELRTPIGIASTSLDLAIRTKDYDKYLPEAKKYLKRTSILIERLLDMARLDKHALNITEVDAEKIIDRVIENDRPLIDAKDITLTFSGENRICADVLLFERLVSNLLENAIKYNVEHGTIDIELKKKNLIICNTGQKIHDDDLPNIFQRYYQSNVSRSDRGYGIGLALVKYICDLHRWKICAHSTNNETIFDIKFKK